MANLNGKRLMMLEGTRLCKMIIDRAHELGIRVIIANWYSVEDAPAKAYADKEYTVNIFDIPAMMKIVKEERIDGIFTGYTDSHLRIYEKLCREAGLPCFTQEGLVDVMVDKALFKKKCAEAGLPVIEEYDTDRILNDEVYAESVVYPVIVKPVDNSGARGISVCRDGERLREAIARGLTFSQSKHVIVERYLRVVLPDDGYCLADFFVQDGTAHYVASSDKPANDDNQEQVNLPGAYIYPSTKDRQIRDTLIQKVQRFVDNIGYKNGLICFELIRSAGEIYIIEAQFRYGAKFQEIFLAREYGIDETEMLLCHALTGSISEYHLDPIKDASFKNSYACMNILLRAGTISQIQDYDEVMKFPCVDIYVPMLKEGAEIKPDGSMVQRLGKVALSAPTRDELEKAMLYFQEHFRVLDTDGRNMVINSL